MSELVNRISGMILLGAYGDAYGAEHETRGHIHDDPFPKRLPARNLANHHWGTWLPAASIPNPATCLLYTSPSPRDRTRSRMPSSA